MKYVFYVNFFVVGPTLIICILCCIEASETGSQANTLEMLSARTITEDSKSYSTYDRRSMEDFHEPPGYQMYEVCTKGYHKASNYISSQIYV